MTPTICIYAKPPVPGQTKSRLARDIGAEAAAALAQAMLQDVCAEALRVAGADVQLWYPPGTEPAAFGAVVPDGITFRQQQGKDLGERMSHTFETLTPHGERHVLLIGSDCTTFSADLFDLAFALLKRVDIIIQPAHDGGYVLVGQASWYPGMFHGVPWGTRDVLNETWQHLQASGHRHCELTPTFDIDRGEDLQRLAAGDLKPAVADWCRTHPALL